MYTYYNGGHNWTLYDPHEAWTITVCIPTSETIRGMYSVVYAVI